MPDPLFDSRTSRFDLPYLFAGQAQKEGTVNEVTARLDALLHQAIEAQTNTPPATPADGQCWLIGSAPTGDWSGHADQLTAREAGNWLFFLPRDGMRILNRVNGQEMRYHGTWKAPARPTAPTGGATVDAEARTAIAALLTALTDAGVIPPT